MSLEELLKRVEGAEGPDREIDVLISVYFDPPSQPHEPPLPVLPTGRAVPFFTASLDATVDLVERVLPEGHWLKEADHTEPRALLLALLRALQAKETK